VGERFRLELQAQLDGEWHTISVMESSGSQDTGRMRRVADNAVVPMRVVEVHGGESDG
jgi:hypothetical protein